MLVLEVVMYDCTRKPLIFDLRHSDVLPVMAENEINSKSNTSTIFINSSRLHVSTLIGSSSGLLFETIL